MPSLKPSESKKESNEGVFTTAPQSPSPSTLEARVAMCVCVCMDGWVHVTPELFKGPPVHISGAGKWQGPHQRAVLSLPACKLFSDKRPGSSKEGSSEGMTAVDSSLDEGWGHPPGRGGLVTDRRKGGPGVGVQFADLLSTSDTSCFPDKLFLCSVKRATLMAPDLTRSAACSLR